MPKPFDPLQAPRVPQTSSEVYAGERARLVYYARLTAQLGPPDFDAAIAYIGRVYGIDKRGR